MPSVRDYRSIVASFEDGSYRWNAEQATGTPVIVTYRLPRGNDLPPLSEIYFHGESVEGFTSFERSQFEKALREYERVAGVRFVEVEGEAMIDAYSVRGLGSLPGSDDIAGYAYYPQVTADYTISSDVVISVADSEDWSPGQWGYSIVLHELGHAMGLTHSHEGRFTLDEALDNHDTTVMTYNWDDAPIPTGLQSLDVSALRYLYGGSVLDAGWTVKWSPARQRVEVEGGKGHDRIVAPSAQSLIEGGGGRDTLFGREDGDLLRGDAGADLLVGKAGADRLFGGAGHDELLGQNGGDLLSGGGRADRLSGGRGSDRLDGGTGNDTLDGGGQSDVILGRAGRDRIDGGEGRDVIDGGDQGDRIAGGTGGDAIRGGAGDDRALGNAGADTLAGGSGDDSLGGGEGRDEMSGGGGHDTLSGGRQGDRLSGDSGRDRLDGGAGDDRLTGGAYADTFVFNGGRDRILDWSEGETIEVQRAALGRSGLDAVGLEGLAQSYGNRIVFVFDAETQLRIEIEPGGAGSLQAILDDVVLI